ncbi:acyl carrier protein [Pectobacterium polaris]|uniref:acyl carrier protein n=1 Tax=Pectobacterium polaris TaxID=2042057 RepID=UPI001F42ABC6|nr:acyl carrier protein [Pectobacterium polaris]
MDMHNTKIIDIIHDVTGLKVDHIDAELSVVGVDSVGLLDVIFKIEEDMGIEFSADELSIENFFSVRKICQVVTLAKERNNN